MTPSEALAVAGEIQGLLGQISDALVTGGEGSIRAAIHVADSVASGLRALDGGDVGDAGEEASGRTNEELAIEISIAVAVVFKNRRHLMMTPGWPGHLKHEIIPELKDAVLGVLER